ncbi:MAG TPA: hypothetical protein VFH73_26415 [Polyangia bacterium]|jgi:hypothetical protein|nr:hypothetical protein [Polyangia bacterium]
MRRAKNLVLPALVTSLMVATTGSARAAEPNVRLVWRRSPAAASCISENMLARAVEQAVGRSVFAPAGGASLAIDGFAERDQAHDAWRATLALSLPDGTLLGRRELSSPAPGCGPLGDMVTLAMALLIRDREAIANSAAPAPVPPPADVVATSTVASSGERVRRTWEATSDASATLSAGLFPNPATGIRLRGVVRSPRAPVFEIEAAFAAPSEARFDPQPQAGGRFYGAWLGGAVCPLEWSSPLWRWRVCGGGSIGVLFFRPFGTNVAGLQRRPLLLGRASTGLERSLGQSWFAVASAEIFVPAIRERFDIRESNPGMATHTLFGMTAVGVIGGLGIGRRF